MNFLIKIVFLISFAAVLSGKVFGSEIGNGAEDNTVDLLVDPVEEYEGLDDEYQIPVRQWKRGMFGFWSPHPSDFNPMRRPGTSGQGPRTNKRSDRDTPYHPIPRSISTKQTNQPTTQNSFNGVPDKRQSPGSFLLMKLGKLSKEAEERRRLGRRTPLPYSLRSGSVNEIQHGSWPNN